MQSNLIIKYCQHKPPVKIFPFQLLEWRRATQLVKISAGSTFEDLSSTAATNADNKRKLSDENKLKFIFKYGMLSLLSIRLVDTNLTKCFFNYKLILIVKFLVLFITRVKIGRGFGFLKVYINPSLTHYTYDDETFSGYTSVRPWNGNDVSARTHLAFLCFSFGGWTRNCICSCRCVPIYTLPQAAKRWAFWLGRFEGVWA